MKLFFIDVIVLRRLIKIQKIYPYFYLKLATKQFFLLANVKTKSKLMHLHLQSQCPCFIVKCFEITTFSLLDSCLVEFHSEV